MSLFKDAFIKMTEKNSEGHFSYKFKTGGRGKGATTPCPQAQATLIWEKFESEN